MHATRLAVGLVWAAAAATTLLAGRAVFAQPAKTVWDGVFTMEQAARGQGSYQKECASCHGATLEGDGAFAPALTAEPFTERWRDGTVGDLLILVQTSMPKERPAALGADLYVDIVTYILKMNNYPAGQTELSKDIAQSKDIRFGPRHDLVVRAIAVMTASDR